MNTELLDPRTYSLIGRLTVQRDKDLFIPDSWIFSETVLVKWQISQLVRGVTIDQIASAILSAHLEIPGLGEFPPEEHSIDPSIQGRDRVQLIGIGAAMSLPVKWKISNVDRAVLNSTLEFYSANFMSGSFNNPIQVAAPDMTPVVAAIQAGTAANVAATQQAAAAINPTVKAVVDTVYNAKVWTTKAEQHIALAPDPNRIGGTIFNKGTVRVAIDRFMDIANRTRDPQHDGFIEPGGTYNLNLEDASEGVLLYTISQTSAQVIPEQQLAISVELKAIP